MKILFVCTGNTCRSAMADLYFRHLLKTSGKLPSVASFSAGTATREGLPANGMVFQVLKELGIDASQHSATPVSETLLEEMDTIYVMTTAHGKTLRLISKCAEEKTRLFLSLVHGMEKEDLADPFGGDLAIYQECFSSIRQGIDNLFLDLLQAENSNITKS